MSCVIEMEPPESLINLATLPLDIVRMIIRMGQQPDNLRLISRSWNTIFSGLKRLNPLERVYLCSGIPDDSNYCYSSEGERQKRLNTAKERLHMYAIVSGGDSFGLGVGGWLRVHDRHSGGAVELTCDPELTGGIENKSATKFKQMACIFCYELAAAFLFFLMPLFIHDLHLPLLGFFLLFTFLTAAIAFNVAYMRSGRVVGAKARKMSSHLSRFIAQFAHIETLAIESFGEGTFYCRGHVLEAALKTLRGVTIDTLEVMEGNMNNAVKNRIINICTVHSIAHVAIRVSNIRISALDHFGQFVIDLAALGVTLDVFEVSHSKSNECFSMCREFWDEMGQLMTNNRISMILKTNGDVLFKQEEYDAGVKSHIRFEKLEEISNRPVKRSRGFSKWALQ